MNNFIRLLGYWTKNTLLDFSLSFWTVLFPILLATFYFAAFSETDNTSFENIPVAVVNNSLSATVVEQIPIFDVQTVENAQAGTELVRKKKVDGFITENFGVEFSEVWGINQTIVRSVANQMKQAYALGEDASKLDFSKQYIQTTNQASSEVSVLFYSLIAAACFYAMYTSVCLVTYTQPNLSVVGARLAITPLKKNQWILINVIITMGLNVLSNLFLIAYIYFVLKIELFQSLGLSLLLIVFANLCATLLGFAIGYSNTWTLEKKISLIQIVSLTLSAFAGMMGLFVRHFIDKVAPIVNQWNPIAVLMNELYRINALNSTETLWRSISVLTIFSMTSGVIAYYFLRGGRYDSI